MDGAPRTLLGVGVLLLHLCLQGCVGTVAVSVPTDCGDTPGYRITALPTGSHRITVYQHRGWSPRYVEAVFAARAVALCDRKPYTILAESGVEYLDGCSTGREAVGERSWVVSCGA